MAKEVKAKYDYNSGHEDDLSFTAGQLIAVTEEVDDEWYNGQYTDSQGKLHQGMFPRNFVTVPPKTSPAPPPPPPPSATRQDTSKDGMSRPRQAEPQLGSPGTTKKQVLPSASRDTAAKSSSPPPAPSANLKHESRTPVREGEPPRQRDNAGQANQPPVNEKPSSFRDRIAAFNKTTDAPLAPRALPKPTSFVRKPFIPPPPSKESYYAPPKPAPPQRTAAQTQSVDTHESIAERNKQADDETPPEPEINKERMKERILAIQKGLDYSTKPPAPPTRRTESHSDLSEPQHPQPHSEEELSDSNVEEHEPVSTKPSAEDGPEPPNESREVEREIDHAEVEKEESTKAEEVFEPIEPEIDPEVARRIAIRERMAKMSGGMGMHMGMGMASPPVFSKSKPPAKTSLSPPSSPPTERRDPIPIIPGLLPIKPKEPERKSSGLSYGEDRPVEQERRSSYIRSSDAPHPKSPDLEKGSGPPPIEESPPFVEDVEAGDSSESGESEEEEGPAHPEDRRHPNDDMSDEESAPPVPEFAVSHGRSNPISPSQAPPIPTSRPFPSEPARRTSRPPPPPPVVPPPISSPPPVPPPAHFSDSPDLVTSPSQGHPYDDSDQDDSSDDQMEESHSSPRESSPMSPVSRPPPPPPILPPKSPPMSTSVPPPIPPIQRTFDLNPTYNEGPPTLPPVPPPGPLSMEQHRTPLHYDISHPSVPQPSSPTSTGFRRTQSERPSVESSHGRSSMDPQRRDGVAYIAMREENIQDGRQWWQDPGSPPTVFRNRPDLIYEIEDSTSTKRGGHTSITREVYILFSDYSQTIVTAQYDRDEPSRATLAQRHLPPPPQPSKLELEARHDQVGHQVVALAQSRLGATIGDGSPLAFVQEIFSKLENCLPSAGARAHGALIYSNFGNSSTKQFDEIRPGDIVAFRTAVFQGHGGLRGKVVTEIGKPDHVAVIQEWNGSKKKLKVLEQRQEIRRVSHSSYKIGELKSGEVHVFRPMPRSWVDW